MNTVSIDGEYRYIIVVEWSRRDTANTFAGSWCPNPKGDETFGTVRLSADGTEPPTHTACNTLANEDMRTEILDAMDKVPFVDVFVQQAGEGAYEVFQRAMDNLGLERIQSDAI